MSLRVLADENIDHRTVHRLEHYDHDVEHVDFVATLGKGTDDARIARYSLDADRLVLTSDDDFLTDFTDDEYRGLLFIEDETLSTATVADIAPTIAETVDHDRIEGVLYVSPNWL